MVLIETLWNVKTEKFSVVSVKTLVLIETLWNVKEDATVWKDFPAAVLIETLWNVKFNSSGGYWNIYYRINRNIVECKDRFV